MSQNPETAAFESHLVSLQRTIGRMEYALGVLGEGVAWTDAGGGIRWCNAAFARLATRPALAAIGKPVDQVLPLRKGGRELEPGRHPVRRVLAGETATGGRPVIEVYEAHRGGGQRRILEVFAARLRSDSETSAMMVVRDNTERHLAEQWLEAEGRRSELLRNVAAAANEAEDPEAALEGALQLVCRYLGWPLGRAVIPGSGWCVWHTGAPVRFDDFVREWGSQPVCLTAGPPQAGKPVWLSPLGEQTTGLQVALRFPVAAMGETRALLEFFGPSTQEPESGVAQLFEHLGAQLARVFERQESRLGLLHAKQDLEHRVAERTRELTALNSSLQNEIARGERYQTALSEAMHRYRLLMQSVRDVIFAVTGRGRVESLNSAFQVLTGLAAEDQLTRRVLSLIHPGDRRTAFRAFRAALDGRQVAPFELRVRHTNGGWVFFECSLTLQTAEGEAPGVAGIARDVTESRRAKAELMVRDRAIAAASEGIVITSAHEPGNPISFANSGFERLTGCGPGEAVGRRLEDLLGLTEAAPEPGGRLRKAFDECIPVALETEARRRDGQSFWARLVITPVRDEGGGPANFVVIVSDISPQKQAERMKNEFVSTVSHELRTPLTSLRGFAELMLGREYPPEKRQKFVEIIHREATRLGNLIDDFLDIQRMEAGRQVYRFGQVTVGRILDDSTAMFRPTSPIHTFEVECEASLPDVRADGDRLRQVATNLLSNAVKFSPKGGKVTLAARREGDLVEVCVSDQGIGIPPEAIGNLFEKFYRVDNTAARKIGGTGLGLSIVKQIVDAHGGRVWIESQVGEGTRVVFTLPVFAEAGQSC